MDPLTAERLRSQQLSDPRAATPEDVVGRLLAVQAQDARGARLSIRARSSGLAARDVDAALTDRRALVISWLNRGTLHLVLADDYWWLHPLVTPQLATTNARRLAQEGVSERAAQLGIETVAGAVKAHGPRTRAQLRSALDEAGVPTAGQALVHVLWAASLAGHVVRGPMREGEHCFVDVLDWLGPPPPPLTPEAALSRLARRYLTGHTAASAKDLSTWAGITLSNARRGLQELADEVWEAPDGLYRLAGATAIGDPPEPMLLGPFDPLLHGWASREFVLGDQRRIITTNGIFRPFALVGGRAVATWTLAGGRLALRPFQRVAKTDLRALEHDAHDVLRFLGLPPSPLTVEPA